ncbi:MAG: restriction endonuclease [Bacteroidales bacterium]|nr:restriction endonuclease [Bacteroidales bacterium]
MKLITKRSGELVPFDNQKLKRSLERTGAGEKDIQEIIKQVNIRLIDGMSTHKVYQMAYSILRRKSQHVAGKYRLKKAIFELGPTGYPFERFVGELLKYQGYQVQVGKIIKGHCVNHEVDVIAEKENKKFMIECKFHQAPGKKSDVKVSLYIQSRFLDVKKQWKKQPEENLRFHQGWIVTNTRFTEDAIRFGKCAGLQLISWDYPEQGSLKQRIDIAGLHPVTALSSITKKEKQEVLNKDIVLGRNLKPENLLEIGIKEHRIKKIMKEAEELIEGNESSFR